MGTVSLVSSFSSFGKGSWCQGLELDSLVEVSCVHKGGFRKVSGLWDAVLTERGGMIDLLMSSQLTVLQEVGLVEEATRPDLQG